LQPEAIVASILLWFLSYSYWILGWIVLHTTHKDENHPIIIFLLEPPFPRNHWSLFSVEWCTVSNHTYDRLRTYNKKNLLWLTEGIITRLHPFHFLGGDKDQSRISL
jgi:hypothetical protein